MTQYVPAPRSDGTIQTVRVKQPWPADKPFRILSIDGGGIKGILPAAILTELERRYLNGEAITNHFDMIAGTSTGGIIALALAHGLRASDILKVYMEHGDEIFPSKWPLSSNLRRWFRSKYDRAPLQNRLQHIFHQTVLNDAKVRVVIPSFEGQHGEPFVFKTPHHPDYKNDRHKTMVHIGLATSAAPTYLRALEAEGYIFVDGGIWANNPIMLAVVDALACYDITREQIQILSLGCGDSNFRVTPHQLKGGKLAWAGAISAAMRAQSMNVLGQSYLLVGKPNVMRLDAPSSDKQIEMDDCVRAKTELPPLARVLVEASGSSVQEMFLKTSGVGYQPCPMS